MGHCLTTHKCVTRLTKFSGLNMIKTDTGKFDMFRGILWETGFVFWARLIHSTAEKARVS